MKGHGIATLGNSHYLCLRWALWGREKLYHKPSSMLPAAAASVLYLKQPDFRVRIEAQPAGSPLPTILPYCHFYDNRAVREPVLIRLSTRLPLPFPVTIFRNFCLLGARVGSCFRSGGWLSGRKVCRTHSTKDWSI